MVCFWFGMSEPFLACCKSVALKMHVNRRGPDEPGGTGRARLDGHAWFSVCAEVDVPPEERSLLRFHLQVQCSDARVPEELVGVGGASSTDTGLRPGRGDERERGLGRRVNGGNVVGDAGNTCTTPPSSPARWLEPIARPAAGFHATSLATHSCFWPFPWPRAPSFGTAPVCVALTAGTSTLQESSSTSLSPVSDGQRDRLPCLDSDNST